VAEVKKQSMEYVRLLKDDSLKLGQAEREGKLNADIKWLHEKVKRAEAKQSAVAGNF
jgi:hypothetical protein